MVPPAIVAVAVEQSGSVNSCRPPIVEMMTTKMIVGRSIGMVICQNCRHGLAPSIAAAS